MISRSPHFFFFFFNIKFDSLANIFLFSLRKNNRPRQDLNLESPDSWSDALSIGHSAIFILLAIIYKLYSHKKKPMVSVLFAGQILKFTFKNIFF